MGPPAMPDAAHREEPPGRRGARRAVRRALCLAAALAGLVLMAAAGGALWIRIELGRSLPRLDGEIALPGLAAPVRVERDHLGVPTIRGENRLDVARATGFVHGQDRFFQMDLLRRRAGGELAELVGRAGSALDRRNRLHRFRTRARLALATLSPEESALLQAYAGGVNAGLASLGARPFEYLLLRARPAPWKPEDTLLVIDAMYLELQDGRGRYEAMAGVMHDVLPGPLVDFLAPGGTEWDAPIAGPPFPPPPTPGPEIVDLRAPARAAAGRPSDPRAPLAGDTRLDDHRPLLPSAPSGQSRGETSPFDPLEQGLRSARGGEGFDEIASGSNNWAVAGSRTTDGRALLANDMHLGLLVPNIWYRASLSWPVEDRSGGGQRIETITGVTLPGTPALVAGSNGRVAWGFTNTQGDWSDLVVLERDPDHPDSYLAPGGPKKIERIRETIHVHGAPDESVEVEETIWGPIVDKDLHGRPRAIRWVAHDAGAANLGLIALERVANLDEALAVAQRSGIPEQNFVAADAAGRIGWTIAGRIPRRVGFDGRLPESWADGSRRWDGWLAPEEVPRIVDPPSGRLWTANARVVGGAMLAALGGGEFVLGARARQIRDDLFAIERAREADMLKIQIDDRAVFLTRWRDLLLSLLTPDAIKASPRRAESHRLVEGWGGRAAEGSAGYRLVRAFRLFFAQRALDSLTAPCRKSDPQFDASMLSQAEGALWKLATEKPPNLLDPKYRSWDEAMLAAVDAALDSILEGGGRLSDRTWGERNTVRIQHPLSLAVPFLGRWLDMPAVPLPGDNHMPRVQTPSFGASERMVVSPGHEQDGFFHMPAGESGHPLSPHYSDEQEAWKRGLPTPFLPGPAVHTLTLTPRAE